MSAPVAAKKFSACAFGVKCTKPECQFIHPHQVDLIAIANGIACKYGVGCTAKGCLFKHPEGFKPTSVQPANRVIPGNPPRVDASTTMSSPAPAVVSGGNRIKPAPKATSQDVKSERVVNPIPVASPRQTKEGERPKSNRRPKGNGKAKGTSQPRNGGGMKCFPCPGDSCTKFGCPKHPNGRACNSTACPSASSCINPICVFAHTKEHTAGFNTKTMCPNYIHCTKRGCKKAHLEDMEKFVSEAVLKKQKLLEKLAKQEARKALAALAAQGNLPPNRQTGDDEDVATLELLEQSDDEEGEEEEAEDVQQCQSEASANPEERIDWNNLIDEAGVQPSQD